MKLATLRDGTRDGQLVVVSRDLSRYTPAGTVAGTMQQALDTWEEAEEGLRDLSMRLDIDQIPGEPFDETQCLSPLPRAYQWADGSAYVNHVELVRKARGAEMPASFWTNPLMYQGGSDAFISPRAPIRLSDEAWGIDFEAEIAAVTDDVPMGIAPEQAGHHIKLLMAVNDVSLRNLIPGELGKGFGFFQSKPSSSFAPVAVTPDELGEAWTGGTIALPMLVDYNGKPFGKARCDVDMTFDLPRLIAHAAKTRPLGAGCVIGLRHHLQQARRRTGQAHFAGRCRLFVHRRTAHGRNHRGGGCEDPVHELRRPRAHRDQGSATAFRCSGRSIRWWRSTRG